VSENRSILLLDGGAVQWLRPGKVPVSLDHAATELDAELARRDHRVVFAAPGGELRLVEITIAAEERRHLATSLPFMLEESIAEDIEHLHFARQMLDRRRCGVAVVASEHMARWHEVLGARAARLPWVPEPLLLPWRPGEWTLVLDGSSALLRWGECLGSRIETPLLAPLLAGLEARGAPERLVIYSPDTAAGDGVRLPASLLERAEWRRGDLASALWLASDEVSLNLLQGAHAPQLPYREWWGQWRNVAAILAVAIVGHLGSSWLDLERLERHNEALRREIQEVYRGVNPRGAVVDPERQLRRQLRGLSGGEGGAAFTALLAPVAAGMAAEPGLQLASLTYSQARDELLLNLLAPDFDAVETLRAGLASQGLAATLESSSRSGDRVRARLRVGGSA